MCIPSCRSLSRSRRPAASSSEFDLAAPAAVERVHCESLRSKLATVFQDDGHPSPAPSVWHERKPIDLTPGHHRPAPYPPPYDNVGGADLDASPPGMQTPARQHDGDRPHATRPASGTSELSAAPAVSTRRKPQNTATTNQEVRVLNDRGRSGTAHRLAVAQHDVDPTDSDRPAPPVTAGRPARDQSPSRQRSAQCSTFRKHRMRRR